ncbi:sigma-54-dependent transcriptional regulator [Alkaliphilus transvaalensis]|uniref:sigma-54-dependent transcriptional regulator n=1 Tax=Alkaliphilus transvaalensis TaxID=114628 RepID=UPI0004789349|nr:sigma-54 dependent transcriptional regulator [Alkaliphilus transvaalensis]
MHKKILVVDDEKNMRWALRKALEKEKYVVYEASNGKEAIEKFNSCNPNLVLLDLKMPAMDGLEALKKIKVLNEEVPIIMITAHGTMETAIEAMKIGALDYISKPFEVEELKVTIQKALGFGALKEELNYLREELEHTTGKQIIGASNQLKNVMDMVERVSKTNATVLILGESGTGKELIANAIHYSSDRKAAPYVKINCGAIPENLIESELFGYEKGAFTGAATRKIGKFERANGGTIFLDEVGELDLGMQVKLLRVLQEKEIERIGGTQPIKIDVRVVAATNRDLFSMVEEGRFREDLYYRLNVIPIQLPPLRERKEDIPLLVNYFLEKFSQEVGKGKIMLEDGVAEKLLQYQWKGNIRELENVIERMVILSDGNKITVNNLPKEILVAEIREEFLLPENGLFMEDLEKNLILQALERTDYNQTKAAQLLGISRHTLIYRMEKYSIKK